MFPVQSHVCVGTMDYIQFSLFRLPMCRALGSLSTAIMSVSYTLIQEELKGGTGE